MEFEPKFKIVIHANGFSHVRYSDSETELLDYSDNVCAVCSAFRLPVHSILYRLYPPKGIVYTRKENFSL